ncbi:MAG: ABC transporter ATP-binding protein [Thermoleophilia bacterium]|nr:ABC transporter ATP-binding protein [Thermoleophilia bacterium]
MLETREVSKHFGGVKAVNGVSLMVEEYAIVGLIGPNGAGKTTLFSVISGALSLTSGRVSFEGADISGHRPWEIAEKGVVRTFQTPRGFPRMSVLENMLVFASERTTGFWKNLLAGGRLSAEERRNISRADEILSSVGLLDRRNVLVEELSAGELKLLEFARPLMAKPKMLLLDEPAAGVNPALLEHVVTYITQLRNNGLTFFIVDHNLGFIMDICDHLYVMADGELICSGAPDAVACDPNVIESYIGTKTETTV